VNSEFSGGVVAREEERVAAVGGADEVVHPVTVLGDDHAAVGRHGDVVGPVRVDAPVPNSPLTLPLSAMPSPAAERVSSTRRDSP
jgi:hypothetical protein